MSALESLRSRSPGVQEDAVIEVSSEDDDDGCSCCDSEEASEEEEGGSEVPVSTEDNPLSLVTDHPIACCSNTPAPRPCENPGLISSGACCNPSTPNLVTTPDSPRNSCSSDAPKCSSTCCTSRQDPGATTAAACRPLAREGRASIDCCGKGESDSIGSSKSSLRVPPNGSGCQTSYSGSLNTPDLACSKAKPAHRKPPQDFCKCCVDILLKERSIKALASLLNRVKDETTNIRRCCQALLGVCCPTLAGPKGCCEGEDDCGSHAPTEQSEKDLEEPGKSEGGGQKSEPTPNGRKYTMEISGLDCPDCLVKIKRAVGHLGAGVSVSNLDFVRGTGNLHFKDEGTDPKSICRFLANVTGFGIKLVTPADRQLRRPLTLPIVLTRSPPPSLLAELKDRHVDCTPKKQLHFLFDLDVHHDGALKPRELMSKLSDYGPRLLHDEVDPIRLRIRKDLSAVGLRTIACLLLTIPILVFVWSPLRDDPHVAYKVLQLLLATGVVILAWPIYRSSFALAWYLRAADLGLLTTVSTLTAYIFSVVTLGLDLSDVYHTETLFETVGLLVTLIYLGRTVQVYTRRLASSMLDGFSEIQPKTAQLVEGSIVKTIDVRLLHYGDTVRVSNNQTIPTDGIVCAGQAAVNESAVTGESVPILRSVGASVSPGNVVVEGSIDIIVTHLLHENSITMLKSAVQAAHSSETRYADMADRFASWLLPVASVCSIISLVVWMLVHRYVRNESWGRSVVAGITYAVAVLAVSCPCALALAVSSVVSVSIAVAMKEGIVFRSASAIHHASQIDTFAFDKTGTLSQSVLAVVHAVESSDLAQEFAHILCHASSHPIANAVHSYLKSHRGVCQDIREFASSIKSLPGKGILTTTLGITLRGGNALFTGTTTHPQVAELLSQGMSVFIVTLGGQLIAAYALLDQPRQGAMELIGDLVGRRSKDVVLISGDNAKAVNRFAQSIQFPLSSTAIFADCTPQRKAEIVTQLRLPDTQPKSKNRKVAFIGDGINDSIALAAADLAISLGSATDVAISSSSVVLLGNDIHRMMMATLDLAAIANVHTIVALVWCGVYFLFAILLAGGAFVNFRIPPSYAGLGELVSIAPVLVVAANVYVYRRLQLYWRK